MKINITNKNKRFCIKKKNANCKNIVCFVESCQKNKMIEISIDVCVGAEIYSNSDDEGRCQAAYLVFIDVPALKTLLYVTDAYTRRYFVMLHDDSGVAIKLATNNHNLVTADASPVL